jgi:hypothetical protein
MVKLLLSLECKCIFNDPKNKKNIIRDINGQSILYYIVKNMPEYVYFPHNFFLLNILVYFIIMIG